MTALHLDEEWFCRAAWRHIVSKRPLPDVVHAHAVHQAARLRRADLPVVINLPGAPHTRYIDDLQAADALVADGWAADHLPAMLGCPVTPVPKGVDAAHFSPDGGTVRARFGLEGKPVVIGVGRLVPIKNMALLVDAMPHVRTRIPNARLLLVGEGPEQTALEQRAADLGVAEAITFAGYVPLEELPTFYRSADVFALTSHFDNSPNVVLEAMSAELPVVATNVGGVSGFVDEHGGSLVPAGGVEQLAAALVGWLDSPARSKNAGAFNRRRVIERHSWRSSALKLIKVYESVAQSGRRSERRTA